MDDYGGSMKIEKLMETDYHAWKQKIVILLPLKDVDGYIWRVPLSISGNFSDAPNEGDYSDEEWIRGDKIERLSFLYRFLTIIWNTFVTSGR